LTITPGVNAIKLFYFAIDEVAKYVGAFSAGKLFQLSLVFAD
jgi:hypothetical protein